MENGSLNLKKFDEMVLKRKATWWEMMLPAGDVVFGDVKTEMLGYSSEDFKHYSDFTKLLHEEDYDKAMQAMRDHMEGKKDFYETTYRIKSSDGSYIRFYDCGKVAEKDGDNMKVVGFVMRVEEDQDIIKQAEEFKKLILSGKPSMVELVQKTRASL